VVSNSVQHSFCEVYRTIFMLASGEHTPYNSHNYNYYQLYTGTPANFNGFRVLAALLHGTVVVGVSQTLRHWTEGATYIRQGGHHVGHWPTFL